MTIEEVESQAEQGLAKLRSPEYRSLETLLQPLIPRGYRPHVSLVYPKKDGKTRKARRNASADHWTPDIGEIRIYFEPDAAAADKVTLPVASAEKNEAVTTEPTSDLVRTLHQVELRPNYQFVALKRFRDVDLPAEGFDWAKSDSMRQSVLRDAIERRLILTSRVPNPKSPQFPVTAIRLNRLLPEVQTILGAQTSVSDFNPIAIRGEALSATILRDRR